jgi:hypothetical protein
MNSHGCFGLLRSDSYLSFPEDKDNQMERAEMERSSGADYTETN